MSLLAVKVRKSIAVEWPGRDRGAERDALKTKRRKTYCRDVEVMEAREEGENDSRLGSKTRRVAGLKLGHYTERPGRQEPKSTARSACARAIWAQRFES
jgi:hypothetical protein